MHNANLIYFDFFTQEVVLYVNVLHSYVECQIFHEGEGILVIAEDFNRWVCQVVPDFI